MHFAIQDARNAQKIRNDPKPEVIINYLRVRGSQHEKTANDDSAKKHKRIKLSQRSSSD